MQQEVSEAQSEDTNALPDKNKKRRFKTPAQVQALESFYNEHKYPSEELKAQFAVSVGLTEKQISGWFCHRRLKDKRLSGEASANGKQDRSSGIIVPDHGSGHKQDSCGSTKEGGIARHFDHREVQSRGKSGQDLVHAEYDHGRPHDEKISDLDDTSSGSSSSLPLQNRVRPQNKGPADVATFSYPRETGSISRGTNLMGIRTRPGPSGYLKVKSRPENPAITSVKRQLGRHYKEDGPSLSVDFDSVPPGAFETSMNNPIDQQHSSDVPLIFNQPDSATSCDVYNVKMSPYDPHSDGSDFRVKPPSHGHAKYLGSPPYMQKPAFPNRCTPFPKQNSSSKPDEEFSFEKPVYDRRPYAQHGFDGRRKDDGINSGGRDSLKYKYYDSSLEKAQRQLVKHSEPSDLENRRLSGRLPKDGKFVRERTTINESSHLTGVQGGKRVWEEFLEQRCKRKALKEESPLWTNQTKRSAAADMPSSFSEDETAETSASED